MLKQVTLSFAVIKALADIIKEEIDAGKDAVVLEFEETGAKSATAALPDGTDIATVTLVESAQTIEVRDTVRFVEWVRTNAPGVYIEERTETRVVPASFDETWFRGFAGTLTISGDDVVSKESGESIPGLGACRPKRPYPMVKFKPGARDAIRDAWRTGSIDALLPTVVPALEGGGE